MRQMQVYADADDEYRYCGGTMHIQDIKTLFHYNTWANELLLSKCDLISHEQFIAPTPFSYGSLRGTLVHTLDAEWGWRSLCQGLGASIDLIETDFPTVGGLRERWREEAAQWRFYIDCLTDTDLLSVLRYSTSSGIPRERVLWHCLFHVVNHGMQHRSEAAQMLTQYGQSPGDIDFTVYLNDNYPRKTGPLGG